MALTRYGLIGCGMMGREHIRNLALLGGTEIVALYEPDPGMRALARDLVPGAAAMPSLAALLARPDLDALVIASPNDCHRAQFEQIAATRPLPVMLEKPAFTTPGDAARLRTLGRRYAAPVWVAMEYRYMPAITALIAQTQAVTGDPLMLTIREHRFPFLRKVGDWNRSNARTGGTLVEKCCHFFDLMRLILQSEPVRVMASASQAVNHKEERPAAGPPDIWDNAYVIVDFDSGARAMLELCMFAEGSLFQEEVTVVGPRGKITARLPGPGRFWPEHLGPVPLAQLEVAPRLPKGPVIHEIAVDPSLLAAGDHNGATFFQHQKFLALLRDGGQPEVSLEDGIRAVEIGQAAQIAAAEGRVVNLGAP